MDSPEERAALGSRAASDLDYIRRAMERAGSFTAISGLGMCLVGLTALAAAMLAGARPDYHLFWLASAPVALVIATSTSAAKSRRAGLPFLGPSWAKFAAGFVPPALVGALLTVEALSGAGARNLPAIWLLAYGAAISCGGVASIVSVRVLGAVLIGLGAVALFAPPGWGQALLAVGFGVVHLIFGIWISRRHGG